MSKLIIVVFIFTLIITLITIVVMRITKNKELINPALLATVFPNTGNIGLPVLMFAYGNDAFSIGVIIVVVNFVFMYTLGIYFASVEGANWTQGLKNIIKLPTTYATVLAILCITFHIQIPDFIYDPIKLMGDAMVPVCLILLGVQLSRTKIRNESTLPQVKFIQSIALITILRLIIGPLITMFILTFGTFEPLMAKVLILQNSMPTAVIMTMIAEEYKARPGLVANATFINTIFSVFTITGLLYLIEYYF